MALVAAFKALFMITKPVTAENEEGIRTGTAEGVDGGCIDDEALAGQAPVWHDLPLPQAQFQLAWNWVKTFDTHA